MGSCVSHSETLLLRFARWNPFSHPRSCHARVLLLSVLPQANFFGFLSSYRSTVIRSTSFGYCHKIHFIPLTSLYPLHLATAIDSIHLATAIIHFILLLSLDPLHSATIITTTSSRYCHWIQLTNPRPLMMLKLLRPSQPAADTARVCVCVWHRAV